MSDFATKRLLKLRERDIAIANMHLKYPSIAEIDRQQASLVFKTMRIPFDKSLDREHIEIEYHKLGILKEELLYKNNLSVDIYEPSWDCEICKDRGYIAPGRPCVCKKEHDSVDRRMNSGLPFKSLDMTFDTFDCNVLANSQKAVERVSFLKNYANRIINNDSSGNLLISGGVGRGKTHLAIAVANELLLNNKTVFYQSIDSLIESLRIEKFESEDKNKNKLKHKLIDVDLLILDDLGRESISEFVISQLTFIVETRNDRDKPWVINTNLGLEEIKKLYGDRFTDRILENTFFEVLKSEKSYRLNLVNTKGRL